jgi:hypothetical protein
MDGPNTREIARLNGLLLDANEAGRELLAEFRGKPDARVPSLNPLSMEPFDFWHRAPTLSGRFALRLILTNEQIESNAGKAGIVIEDADDKMYGAFAQNAQVLNTIGYMLTSNPDYRQF